MLIKDKRIPIKQIILMGFLPSSIKKMIYRIKGYKIGKKVRIGIGSVIIGESVTIEDGSSIGLLTFIISNDIRIGRFVQIGSFTYIKVSSFSVGEDTRIRENVYVSGLSSPESELSIGKRVIIMQYSFLNPTKPIIIEDDTGIGGMACIFTHASWQSALEGYPVAFAPVILRKNVWIAWRVFILPGVEIGENSTIGADSTVTANVPPHSLASGSPLKIHLSGEKIWPRKISAKAQQMMMDNINMEFAEYLRDNGFDVDLNKSNFHTEIHVKNMPGKIYFTQNAKSAEKAFNTEDTLITFADNSISGLKSMVLQIKQKLRIGSNPLGEEYVRYLSRYGIRFDRMD
jgi:acetyltransferase-like isoleucine patch superfamily enzyme